MRRVRHTGESRGFTNAIVLYPERRLAVVILTNRSGGKSGDIAQHIADLYLPARSDRDRPVAPAAESISRR